MIMQLDLLPDAAKLCVPLRLDISGTGWNQTCSRCWMGTLEVIDGEPTLVACGCNPGCWECGAMPGELGCQHCDADSERAQR